MTFTRLSAACTLATMTTRDERGAHFTDRYPQQVLIQLEKDGLIVVDRPIHDATGIPYDRSHWSVEVAPIGVALVDDAIARGDIDPMTGQIID